MLKAHGSSVVCVDSTHGTNMYDFLLITILVLDEFGEGLPIAWAISNKEDTETLTVFMKKLRVVSGESGELQPVFFMTDDANQYWNSWKAAYGNTDTKTKKLLCAWHVDKNWRKAIRENIHGSEAQATVYHHLQVILKETNKSTFRLRLQQFMTIIKDKHLAFFRYFSAHYAGRTDQWATCERIGTVTNTNMHIESFHRLLKVVYLEGKHNRRLDRLLSILLKIARDKYFERVTKEHKGKKSHRIREINKRHKNAEEMIASGAKPIQQSPTKWNLMSLSSPGVSYTIQICEHVNCTCKIICNSCKVCSQTYSCSCVDYACKHIHLIQMVSKNNPQPDNLSIHCPGLEQEFRGSLVEMQSSSTPSFPVVQSLEHMRDSVFRKTMEVQVLLKE